MSKWQSASFHYCDCAIEKECKINDYSVLRTYFIWIHHWADIIQIDEHLLLRYSQFRGLHREFRDECVRGRDKVSKMREQDIIGETRGKLKKKKRTKK